MKKTIAVLIALLMLLSLAACGANHNEPSAADPADISTDAPADTAADTAQPTAADAESAKLTGTLQFINKDDRDPSVLRGVSFSGNRSGTVEFNAKAPATDGIRCIFELNEYVAALPDTDITEGIEVYVLAHTDGADYAAASFSEDMPGFAYLYLLNRNEDDAADWGSFYLNPEDAAPGYYDFVFVYEGKALATLTTRFYNAGELEAKTDAELEALMKE